MHNKNEMSRREWITRNGQVALGGAAGGFAGMATVIATRPPDTTPYDKIRYVALDKLEFLAKDKALTPAQLIDLYKEEWWNIYKKFPQGAVKDKEERMFLASLTGLMGGTVIGCLLTEKAAYEKSHKKAGEDTSRRDFLRGAWLNALSLATLGIVGYAANDQRALFEDKGAMKAIHEQSLANVEKEAKFRKLTPTETIEIYEKSFELFAERTLGRRPTTQERGR